MPQKWLALFVTCLAIPAHAQYLQQGSKLTGSGSVGSSAIGISVAISADGNTAAVGGPADATGAGAVWVYTRNNGSWVQQGPKLVSSQSAGPAAQGSAVALSADGNTMVVGGLTDNGGTGAMWGYARVNGVWTQQGPRRWGSVDHGLAHQGVSIALSADGNTALVGGELDNNDTNQLGAAWVFTRSNGEWGPLPFKLIGNTSPPAHLGASVALSADGNTAILGGPFDNSGTGCAIVFTRVNGAWVQQGNKLTGFDARVSAAFGSSVAISSDGNTAVIGGSGDSTNTGAVWVFTRNGGVWSQQGSKLVGTHPISSRYLGQSVAVTADGNNILAGGPGGLPSTFLPVQAIGAAWLFSRNNGTWSQQGAEFTGTGTAGNDALQGTSIAMTPDGITAIMGGPADNGNIGAAWVFTRPAPPAAPSITTQPASQSITNGQSVTLSVVAAGAAPLSYQWYQGSTGNTSTPVGQNSPSYTTTALLGSINYWVRVSNPYGSIDSATAVLSLLNNGPVITQVVSVANQSPTIAPNTWVEIHGTNLAPTGDTRLWQGSDFKNNQLPVQLDTVTATVNGRSAFVEYISPTQVNILTPPDAMQGSVQVLMSSGGVNSAPFTVQAQALAPAFFTFSGGPYVAAEHTDGSYLGPASLFPGVTTPAKPGETVVLFGSGFGPTAPAVVSGSPVQNGVLTTTPVIIIGGIAATVQYGGLVVPGEFQFNVIVPLGVPDGDATVTAVFNGLTSQSNLRLAVQH